MVNKCLKPMFILFTLSLLFCRFDIAWAAPDPKLELTPEEAHFLSLHPVLRVTNEKDWPPYDFMEDGKPAGLSIDYLKIIEKKLNVKFEYVNEYSWDELLQMGFDKKLDILQSIVQTPQRSEKLLYTPPYTVMKYGFAVSQKFNPVESFGDLAGKTVAYPKGYSEYEWILRTYPKVNVLLVLNAEEGLRAVAEGKADAYYDDYLVISKVIEDEQIAGMSIYTSLDIRDPNLTYLRLAVRDDWPLLKSILEKAMNTITFEEKQLLSRKWTGGMNLFYSATDLSIEEQQWIKEHSTIRLAAVPNLAPLSFYDSNDQYSGIASDYLNELSKELDVKFEIEKINPDEDPLQKVLDGQVDVAVPVAVTLQGEQKLFFSQPVYTLPIVVYANDKHPIVEDLYNLPGTRIAVAKGSPLFDWITRDYPGVSVYPVEDTGEALKQIENGASWILVDDFLTANRKISEQGYKNVRIVGNLNYKYDMSFAINKDKEILRSILQKTLQKIQDQKQVLIAQKWLTQPVVLKSNNNWIYQIAAGIALIFAILIYRALITRRLMRKITKHMEIIDQNILSIKLNRDKEIEEISTALRKRLNISLNAVKGKAVKDLFDIEGDRDQCDIAASESFVMKYQQEGKPLSFQCDLSVEKNGSGIQGYVAILKEVPSEQSREEGMLKDGLTGAYNRRAYDLFVNHEMLLARRNGQLLAYMLLDLDNFKSFNDHYGHLSGDDALKQVVEAVGKCLKRPNDYLFRLGGERFILLSSHQNVNQAVRFAEEIRQTVADLNIPHKDNAPWSGLTVSIGLSFFKDQDPVEEEALYVRADEALYRAKESGKNRIEIV